MFDPLDKPNADPENDIDLRLAPSGVSDSVPASPGADYAKSAQTSLTVDPLSIAWMQMEVGGEL